MEDRESYIEFRLYIKKDADLELIVRVAQELQDKFADFVSDTDAPEIFTEDVTYTIVHEVDLKERNIKKTKGIN